MSRRIKKMPSTPSVTPIYLFVEGKKTEPEYFGLFKQKFSIQDFRIFNEAGKSSNALLEKAKSRIKLGNLDPNALKYLVFDKDALTDEQFTDVFEKAKNEGFKIGFSNLNFEVWLLAHFEKLTKRPTSPSDKTVLEAKLTENLNQAYKKGDRKQLEKIVSNYNQAIENASAVNEAVFDYQCTTVGTMLEGILDKRKNKKGGD